MSHFLVKFNISAPICVPVRLVASCVQAYVLCSQVYDGINYMMPVSIKTGINLPSTSNLRALALRESAHIDKKKIVSGRSQYVNKTSLALDVSLMYLDNYMLLRQLLIIIMCNGVLMLKYIRKPTEN